MRIQISSDLHLEFRDGLMPSQQEFVSDTERDVLVLAGDIGVLGGARRFIDRELEISPVVYVLGNHEYYSKYQSHTQVNNLMKSWADRNDGLHVLNGESVVLDGVKFFGTPWFSNLWGEREVMKVVRIARYLSDFDNRFNGRGSWNIMDHIDQYLVETEKLETMSAGADVIVTHWPPTKDAIADVYGQNGLNPYFVNDNEALVRCLNPKMWISGHTHHPFQYVIGSTLCIGNPVGYLHESEERRHKAQLTVDI